MRSVEHDPAAVWRLGSAKRPGLPTAPLPPPMVPCRRYPASPPWCDPPPNAPQVLHSQVLHPWLTLGPSATRWTGSATNSTQKFRPHHPTHPSPVTRQAYRCAESPPCHTPRQASSPYQGPLSRSACLRTLDTPPGRGWAGGLRPKCQPSPPWARNQVYRYVPHGPLTYQQIASSLRLSGGLDDWSPK